MSEPFADRWTRKCAALGFDAIPPEDLGFEFVVCGDAVLPSDAAPFLSFRRATRPTPLWAGWGHPDHWPQAERERLAAYQEIGSDGAGNPLCVEQPGGTIVLLDHEDRFRTRQFVNSSVGQLAECLLAYMGERDESRFRAVVLAIDPLALAEQSFWWHEAAGIAPDAEPDAADGPRQ